MEGSKTQFKERKSFNNDNDNNNNYYYNKSKRNEGIVSKFYNIHLS